MPFMKSWFTSNHKNIIWSGATPFGSTQEGSSISWQNLNENLETLHLAPTIFYHLSGFYLKIGFLNPHPLSFDQPSHIILVQWLPTVVKKRASSDHEYSF